MLSKLLAKSTIFSSHLSVSIVNIVKLFDVGITLILKVREKLPHSVIIVWVVTKMDFLIKHIKVCKLCICLIKLLIKFSVFFL